MHSLLHVSFAGLLTSVWSPSSLWAVARATTPCRARARARAVSALRRRRRCAWARTRGNGRSGPALRGAGCCRRRAPTAGAGGRETATGPRLGAGRSGTWSSRTNVLTAGTCQQ